MKLQNQWKITLGVFFLFSSFVLSGCAKKDSDGKNKLQRSQAQTPNSRLPNISSAQTINLSASETAISFAAARDARLEWMQSFEPTGSSVSGEIVVTNVFEINGLEYDVPTFHPYVGGEQARGTQETYEVDDLLVHTDSACLDSTCSLYVVSVILSRNGSALTQNLVFLDFNDRFQPYYMVNQPNDILSLEEFVGLLYGQ